MDSGKMEIKELTLYTNKLEAEIDFYGRVLGFEIEELLTNRFTVKIGKTKLTFERSTENYRYHYCFLIPSNQLAEAINWLKDRLSIIEIENGRIVQRFESWNADAVYFYDGSKNIVEFIVRYNLENKRENTFGLSNILSVNEIGIPTNQVAKLNKQLEEEIGTKFWKGDKLRFGTNGDEHGLFLLPNYELKKEWFPTTLAIQPSPLKAMVKHEHKEYFIEYSNGILKTKIKN